MYKGQSPDKILCLSSHDLFHIFLFHSLHQMYSIMSKQPQNNKKGKWKSAIKSQNDTSSSIHWRLSGCLKMSQSQRALC